ncbi:MAG TPA: helix-turn-helix domain-containing protein [Flavobacterium sp.]|nr:helix-turn-helix domain-containing protein [Flavobacterium sp.]
MGQLQAKAGLTQSTVSEYLSIFGFIQSKRIGQWTYYKRNEEAIATLGKVIESTL